MSKNHSTPQHPLLSLLLLLWVLCAAPSLPAQILIQTPAQADSLRRVIATTKYDTTRINAFNELANYYYQTSWYDSAMVLARAALEAAERSNFRVGAAAALNNIGQVLLGKRKFVEALQYLFTSLRISEELGNKRGIAASLNIIGVVYMCIYKHSEALEYLNKSLRLQEELGNKRDIARIFTSISGVYSLLGKHADALVYDIKALRIFEELGIKKAIARSLNNVGFDYGDVGNYASALEYLFKALRINEEIGDKDEAVDCLGQIGKNYNRKGEYKLAQLYFFRALQLQQAIGQGETPYILNNIAISYRGQGKYDSALVFALRSLAVADSLHALVHFKQALEELSIISDSLGRHKEALMYHKRYVSVKDSLVNLENLNKTSQLKEAYEAEKREQQITLLNKEKALQESELSRRSVIQWSLAGILAAVAAAAVWLGVLYRQKSEANKAILRQQTILEEQDKEIREASIELYQQNEELTALNTEKSEIMGIVAHDLKNPIGAVRGYAELIENRTFTGDEVVKASGQIVQVSERMLELVKNLLDMNQLESGGRQLNIVSFDVSAVVEAAIYQYRTQAEAKQITLHFRNETDDDGKSIVSADEQAMMQVFDNLVSNAVKYSPHGKNVYVRIRHSSLAIGPWSDESSTNAPITNAPMTSNRYLRIEIQDEGEGISEEDMKNLFGKFARLSARPTGGEHSTGLGLSIVKKMVEAMNGRVWCESEHGKGATFIVEFPATV